MSLNKIGGGSSLPPVLPISLAAGQVFMLPAGQGQIGGFGAVAPPQFATNNPLTGQYILQLGMLTVLQVFDAALGTWRNVNVSPYALVTVSSDGTNYRIANTTGSPVGAVITALGTGGVDGFYGYTAQGAAITIQNGVTTPGNTIFTVATTGGALWNAIVGGGVSGTISLSGTGYASLPGWYVSGSPSFTINAGSSYTKPPIVVFTPPPNQGAQPYILPTATCTVSAGAINAITVVSTGAGLLGLPGITIVPQPGDTTGGGAVLGWIAGNATEQNAGKCLWMAPQFPGTAQTTVPSFTYGGTANPGPTATAIMNFTVTSFSTGTAGVGYTNAYGVWQGGITAGTDATGNTLAFMGKNASLPVWPPTAFAATTALPSLLTGFGGVNIQAVPTLALGTQLAAGTVTTVAVPTINVGGASDTILLFSL